MGYANGSISLVSTTQGVQITGYAEGWEDGYSIRSIGLKATITRWVAGSSSGSTIKTYTLGSVVTPYINISFVDTNVVLGNTYEYRLEVEYEYFDQEYEPPGGGIGGRFKDYHYTPKISLTHIVIEPDKIIRNLAVSSGYGKIVVEFDGPSRTGSSTWEFIVAVRDGVYGLAPDKNWSSVGNLPWTITGGTAPGTGVASSSIVRTGDFSSAKFKIEIPYALATGGVAGWKTRDGRQLQFTVMTRFAGTTHYFQSPPAHRWKESRTVSITSISTNLYGLVRATYSVSGGKEGWNARFDENGIFISESDLEGVFNANSYSYSFVPRVLNANTTLGVLLRFYNPTDRSDYFESNYSTAVGLALPYPSPPVAGEIDCSAYIGRNAGVPLFVLGRDGLDIGTLLNSTDYYFRSDNNLVFVDSVISLGPTTWYKSDRYAYRSASLSSQAHAVLGSGKAYMVIGIGHNQEKELLSGYQYYSKTTTGSNLPGENRQFISEGAGGYSFDTAGGLYVAGVSNYISTINSFSDVLIVSFNNISLSGNSLVYNRPVHPGSPGGVYIGRDSFWVGDLDLSKKFISIIPRQAVTVDNIVPASNYKDLLLPGAAGMLLNAGHIAESSGPVLQIMNHRIDGSTPTGWDIRPNVGRIARGDGAHIWNAGLSSLLGLPRPASTANSGVENVTVSNTTVQIATGLSLTGSIGMGSNYGGAAGSTTVTVGNIRSKSATAICGIAATPMDSYYTKSVPSLNWSDLRNGKVPLYRFSTSSRQNLWSSGELNYYVVTEAYTVSLVMTSDTTIAYRIDYDVDWQTSYESSLGLGDPRPGLANITARIPTYVLNILELN